MYFINEKGIKHKIKVEGVTKEEQENKVSIFSGSFIYYAKPLLSAIEKSNENLLKNASKIDDAIENQRILDAIKESTIEGRTIKLNSGYRSNVKC